MKSCVMAERSRKGRRGRTSGRFNLAYINPNVIRAIMGAWWALIRCTAGIIVITSAK